MPDDDIQEGPDGTFGPWPTWVWSALVTFTLAAPIAAILLGDFPEAAAFAAAGLVALLLTRSKFVEH